MCMELRTLRKALGLSLEKAAAEVGVDTSTLSRWERKMRAPNISDYKKISEWAERRRRRAGLPKSYQIDWGWIEKMQAQHRKRRKAANAA